MDYSPYAVCMMNFGIIHLKHLVIFVVLFAAASLASANLVQQSITPISSKSTQSQEAFQTAVTADSFKNSLKIVNTQILSNLANMQLTHDKTTKIGFLYAKLFDYTAHINQTADQEGLAIFWKSMLIANAIDAVSAQKYWNAPQRLTAVDNDILQIAASSLNDNYANETNSARLNEVPLPAAAWLFTSAIVLFGFARRNNI